MSVSSASNNRSTTNRRQDTDRRQRTEAVSVDRRQAPRRVDNGNATPAGRGVAPTSNSSAAGGSATGGSTGAGQSDTVSVSGDAQQSGAAGQQDQRGFDSFLKNFEGNFDNGSVQGLGAGLPASGNAGAARVEKTAKAEAAAGPQAPKQTPEQERRVFLEKTGKNLYNHSGFTAGEDGLTSREDYQAIADGKRNEDFKNHLKEKNPDWSDEQIGKEVQALQDSSRSLLSDQGAFDFYDNATNQGDARDQSISAQDLASGRLRNDTSKDFPPKLDAHQIADMHFHNPELGNEAVTNKYYHQSQALNERLGGTPENFQASWPAFGQMASNSAGELIRDDGLPGTDRLKNSIAEGNRKVFRDIAPHYDSYLEASKDPNFDYDKWADAEFGPRPAGVEPLSEASKKPDFDIEKWEKSIADAQAGNQTYKDEGKAYLRESFDFLEAAANEKDPDKKQELLLASNVMAGRHEQANLQPEIEQATAPISQGSSVERGLGEALLDKDPTLFMPNGKGSGAPDEYKVDTRLKGEPQEALKDITDPTVRAALAVGLGHSEVPDSYKGEDLIKGTGTENWADLDARMQTITGLMVAKQQDETMGEYILDYDKPRASTVDHVNTALDNLGDKVEGGVGRLGEMGSDAVDKGIDVVKDGAEAVVDVLGSVF